MKRKKLSVIWERRRVILCLRSRRENVLLYAQDHEETRCYMGEKMEPCQMGRIRISSEILNLHMSSGLMYPTLLPRSRLAIQTVNAESMVIRLRHARRMKILSHKCFLSTHLSHNSWQPTLKLTLKLICQRKPATKNRP